MAVAAASAGVGLFLLRFSPWFAQSPDPTNAVGPALALAVGLGSVLDREPSDPDDHAGVRLSFVSDFAALLLLGPVAMTLVATIGALARGFAGSQRVHPTRRLVLDVTLAIAATQAAGYAHRALGGTSVPLAWPWQAVPIAVATAVYSVIACGGADMLVPLVVGAPVTLQTDPLRGCPSGVIGAGLSVAFVEVIDHQAWGVVPVAALPLFFAWRAYAAHAGISERLRRRLGTSESADLGVALIDDGGCVTFWNHALGRLLDCPADRAVGRSLANAAPALAHSELPGAVLDSLTHRRPRILPSLGLGHTAGTRTLHVTILPDACGLLLLWRDVTDQTRSEQALKLSADRFALVAEGASDGLWELSARTQTLYVSPRWRAIVGLLPSGGSVSAGEWFDRVHPDDLAGLKQAIAAHEAGQAGHVEHEHRLRHEDGSYRLVVCRGIAVRDATHRATRLAGSLTDITESAVARERTVNAGLRDSLTGLGNRAAFMEALGRRLSDFTQRRVDRFATLYLDLDRFKVVNDSLGHLAGDELLVAVSRRLETCLRPADTIARLGGDEFAILLHELDDEMQANVVAFRIQEALSKPFSIAGRDIVVSASIGIALSRSDYNNPEEIMRDADTAMYHAKGHGKARHELFDAVMHARVLDRLGLESDLRQAVKNRDFEVHYQPIVLLSSRMCTGFEALVRWKRNGKAVSPADFIPIAEELGLIEELGGWVLREASRTFGEWQRRFPDRGLDCITVNVSMRQLVQQDFLYVVEQAIQASGMKPRDLRLEITETALMDAPQATARVLNELRALGVQIYLDDFGTGYSSLNHLHKLPVDALKIDRLFVRGLLVEDRPAIVESILALAQTLQTDVVAEGVEDEMQACKLAQLGCRRAQGFYFSRPLPARSVEELLAVHQPLGGPPATRGDAGASIHEPGPLAPVGSTNRPAHAA